MASRSVEEPTLIDSALPFAQTPQPPAAGAPLFGGPKPSVLEPPPRVLTPPAVLVTPDVSAAVSMKSEPPPGFAPVAPPIAAPAAALPSAKVVRSQDGDIAPPAMLAPALIAPALLTPAATPTTNGVPHIDVDKPASPSGEGDSPWLHEPPPPPTLTTPATEPDAALAEPEPSKKSSKTPLIGGVALLLLGALGFVGYTFRDRILPPESRQKDAAPITASTSPSKTASPAVTEAAKAPPQATSPEATAAAPATSTPTAALSVAPTQAPTEQPTARPVAPPPQLPIYHPPPPHQQNPGTTQPGGKFDPGGI